MPIRVGEHSCWSKNLVVRVAATKRSNPRANDKHMERAKVFCRVKCNGKLVAPNHYICLDSYWRVNPRWAAGTTQRFDQSIHSTLANEHRFGLAFLLRPRTKPNQTKPKQQRSPRRSLRPPNRSCRARCSQNKAVACPFSGSWIGPEGRGRRLFCVEMWPCRAKAMSARLESE
jgi:hypothetical protein